MVQKLLELELKSAQRGARASALLLELGDVLCDVGDYEKATATYARALGASGGENDEARACLEDVQAESGDVAGARRAAPPRRRNDERRARAKARLFLRAARIARRFAPDEVEALLGQAYAADPHRQAGGGALREAPRRARSALERSLEHAAAAILDAAHDPARARDAGAPLRRALGLRVTRTSRSARSFLEEALKLDPTNEGAFHLPARRCAARRTATGIACSRSPKKRTRAARTATRRSCSRRRARSRGAQLGNLMRARTWFERLAAVAPEHPQLRAFEAQIGETLAAPTAAPAPG